MRTYVIPPDRSLSEASQLIGMGVVRARVSRQSPAYAWLENCSLELADGRAVEFRATESTLEFKFEVFPLAAAVLPRLPEGTEVQIQLKPPVTVTALQMESWIETDASGETYEGASPLAHMWMLLVELKPARSRGAGT